MAHQEVKREIPGGRSRLAAAESEILETHRCVFLLVITDRGAWVELPASDYVGVTGTDSMPVKIR